jgi:ankyrin repeat protein
MELLVKAKADIAANDLRLQRGVLHLAAANGHSDIIAILVHLGASTLARDRSGMTPIEVAEQCGHLEVASALHAATADFSPLQPLPSVLERIANRPECSD